MSCWQCHNPLPTERASTVSTQHQLVLTRVNSVLSWLPGQVAFQVCSVCGKDVGSELTTNSLIQKSSQICLSTSFSLWCIDPQALLAGIDLAEIFIKMQRICRFMFIQIYRPHKSNMHKICRNMQKYAYYMLFYAIKYTVMCTEYAKNRLY